MAYGLKYQSDFYNAFKVLVSVKIYKRDYTDSTVTNVRTSEVTIESNYQNDNTPVIGTGAKIVLIATSNDMTYLEDLLLSYEREFLCTIEYDGVIAFRGVSLCDLNERQLLPFARVTLQFTDYVHRLSEQYPECISKIGLYNDVYSLVENLIQLTSLDLPLYVNSTLFEDSMNNAATDTFLPQVFVQNAQYFSNTFEYDNMYDAINKTLQPFNAFIYYSRDKWIVERQEDITRPGNWVCYDSSDNAGTSVPSLKQTLNKQNGDFSYVEMSQVIEYDTGLHTLILDLQDKKLESLVFNDYTGLYSVRRGTGNIYTTTGILPHVYFYPKSVTDKFPREGDLTFRTWYIHHEATEVKVGAEYLDINTWIHWHVDPANDADSSKYGLYYRFTVQFNTSRENDSVDGNLLKDTILNVEYKNGTEIDVNYYQYRLMTQRFLLRLSGGPWTNYWVGRGIDITTGYDSIILYPPIDSNLGMQPFSTDPENFVQHITTTDITEEHQKTWSLTQEFPLTGIQCVRRYDTGRTTYDSLWAALGYPDTQDFIIMFLPPSLTNQEKEPLGAHTLDSIYFGDVTVTITTEDIDNRIEYHLNEDFVKTDEIELHLFDLDNQNFSNGLMLSDKTYTNSWFSENSVTPIPLYEVFAKCKFRKYGRTIHRLKSKIRCNQILKPFAILTDSNVGSETSEGVDMTLILNGFTWDVVNGIYDIVAEEYTEEEVIVDGVTYDSGGEQEVVVPDAPLYISANLRDTFTHPVIVVWDSVAGGITGYRLQRRPYWDVETSAWVNEWKTRYEGTLNRVTDMIHNRVGTPCTSPQTLYYRVCAFNDVADSDWVESAAVNWYR
jgi:hypothetical protein